MKVERNKLFASNYPNSGGFIYASNLNLCAAQHNKHLITVVYGSIYFQLLDIVEQASNITTVLTNCLYFIYFYFILFVVTYGFKPYKYEFLIYNNLQ